MMKITCVCKAILLLLVVVLVCEGQVVVSSAFVETRSTEFIVDGSPFLFNGFNSYWMMTVASQPSRRSMISNVFRDAAAAGLTVCRTWAFSDGGDQALQMSPGVYNEAVFQEYVPCGRQIYVEALRTAFLTIRSRDPPSFDQETQSFNFGPFGNTFEGPVRLTNGLDFVTSEARKYGLKLILSLSNNYKEYGGKAQYVQWARSAGVPLGYDDDFYTNAVVKSYYKNHVKKVLTRINTFTGVAYKDDSTIMAWELMNEPRCNADISGKTVNGWVQEMASYVKSTDKKHLLEIGMEGFYGDSIPDRKQYNPGNYQVGTDFITNNQIKEVDFTTIHAYPDQWLSGQSDSTQMTFVQRWLTSHLTDSRTILKKPLVFSEFGKSKKDPGYSERSRDGFLNTLYGNIYELAKNGGIGGGLVWQIMAEGMDSYYDGYEIVLSQNPSTADVISQQSKRMTELRHS